MFDAILSSANSWMEATCSIRSIDEIIQFPELKNELNVDR